MDCQSRVLEFLCVRQTAITDLWEKTETGDLHGLIQEILARLGDPNL